MRQRAAVQAGKAPPKVLTHSHVKPVAAGNKPLPVTYWETVTPAMAVEWLEKNTLNRAVRDALVAELGRDMLAGRWRGHNGEAIRFDTEGRLVDGQHRLWACVTANVPFVTLVVTGIDPDDYDTIGIGRKKSFGDFMREEKNRTLLAAAVRLAFLWESGRLATELRSRGSITASVKELQETLAACPNIREAVNRVASGFGALKGVLSHSYASLLYYSAMKSNLHEEVEEFLSGVRDGLNMDDMSPVYQLRKVLLANQGSRRKLAPPMVLALAIKAWNCYIDEKKVLQLRFRVDEEFPVLRQPVEE